MNKSELKYPLELTQEDLEQGASLVAQGYLSTSNKYRMVGCLPLGKTALEVLEAVAPEAAIRLRNQLERQAKMEALRVYRVGSLELTPQVYKAFRRAGGQAV